ncbi:16S rRNA (uracil(1498)-N(3))-methyltransferase [Wenyingzhuangia sp. 2_MG-2023]|uniref:16S rRNA (uracil(1498)-N(3))-methyltransferase n=1 Tax=Wenyingzhuangia sp. 2_MG-2023 TaxID=3062639 RepID=UPI0026E1AD3F|nr:16S rRNA (uracil(1498)-N(3))-methyltransferase [Wenyingzhuangia sp. 2_MG-2023]MDO6737805.1 16S rRNA (uracil(1498)-N(3))-methyltransferase [Wenyingzhuangia sp. 2_MG-2023]MDO6802088.1 16S rRNA (uracil(1498)-N(3))-methyltransferase [Wenyingzhuangia sp. 1_MG-2023]
MILSISEHIQPTDTSFVFDKDESRHLIKVLRKKEGDFVYITDGKGNFYTTSINLANEKRCIVVVDNVTQHPKNRPYHLHIAIAPTKLNDRYEWFLEKAVEIGIDEITPIICKNSERKIIKIDRMKKIIQSAIKQSLQLHLPILNEPVLFDTFLKQQTASQKFIAHCEDEDNKKYLQKIAKPSNDLLILVGPEGDFTPNEIDLAIQQNYIPVTLGQNRLRTETAGVYITSLMTTLL